MVREGHTQIVGRPSVAAQTFGYTYAAVVAGWHGITKDFLIPTPFLGRIFRQLIRFYQVRFNYRSCWGWDWNVLVEACQAAKLDSASACYAVYERICRRCCTRLGKKWTREKSNPDVNCTGPSVWRTEDGSAAGRGLLRGRRGLGSDDLLQSQASKTGPWNRREGNSV